MKNKEALGLDEGWHLHLHALEILRRNFSLTPRISKPTTDSQKRNHKELQKDLWSLVGVERLLHASGSPKRSGGRRGIEERSKN